MAPRWTLSDLAALDLFVSVVETGSVSKAAKEHQISQPSASARLAKLEKRLQLRLLRRGPSGSVPTESGEALAAHAQDVLKAAEIFEQAAKDLRDESGGYLRVAASPIVGEYVLPRLLQSASRFTSRITVLANNSTDVLAEVLAERSELGIAMFDPPSDTSLAYEIVGYDDVLLVTHPNHALAKRLRPLKVHQLASEPLVVRAERPGTRSLRGYATDALAEYHGGPPPKPIVELGSTNAVKNAALAGVGPALLTRLTVVDELNRGSLVEISVTGIQLRRICLAVWLARRGLGPASRQLLTFAKSEEGLQATGLKAMPDAADAGRS